MSASAQVLASDPKVSAFVTANAGSGKTRTLVARVARLLLRGARPDAILCVTYTKAAAAEMQGRLFETLGEWAVLPDDALARELAGIDERPADLSGARRLFARALETPGGLKIQTIHAFCEKLLRRFPLEAGVSPGFRVLEDQAARQVSAAAREEVARAALQDPEGRIGRAYARFAVDLDYRAFQEMFAAFEARRTALDAHLAAAAEAGGYVAEVWRRCGFEEPASPDAVRAQAMSPPALDVEVWRRAATALWDGSASDQGCAQKMAAVAEGHADFDLALEVFCTDKGQPRRWPETTAVLKRDPTLREAVLGEQERVFAAARRARSARVAEDTVAALTLASAYIAFYEAAKAGQSGLDFADLIQRTHALLTRDGGGAAWVLYKLDGGLDHVLVDEAQDTAPDQWDIVDRLTEEFFAGEGAGPRGRTTFAVGDEKQSIFSFQGADPARFLKERGNYQSLVQGAGGRFEAPDLLQSFRSTPEVLAFVDAVFADPDALAALRPGGQGGPVRHQATRPPGSGSVELWELEEGDPSEEADPWAPVDAEPAESGNRKLAWRIAREVRAMVERGEAVGAKGSEAQRPMGFGDVLILVRRRGALFHEIIRALKREGVPVGGADRLTLSDHVVFHDLVGLARFCLYPSDDLTLAALLRSPFCDGFVDDELDRSLFDLAHGRPGSLWSALRARAGERPEWQAALDFLEGARAEARSRPPFDFYARLLGRTDRSGRSVRARILTRLGREAEQALDAFLAQALAAERRGVRDLETFAHDMAASEVEVKREQDEGHGEVRVMTVHGAKGLEAPVVILPDTATRAQALGGPLLQHEGGFLWCARKGEDSDTSGAARQARADAADRESLRLLYVALTRARDRLIVAGVRPGVGHLFQRSWRDYVERGFARPDIAAGARELEREDGRPVRRYGPDPRPAGGPPAPAAVTPAAPDWLARPAPSEPPPPAYASPSRMTETAPGAAPSPLAAVGGLGRFRRGDLVHRLLQLLPDVPAADRPAAALSLLERERDLTQDQREEMASAALGVLQDERFAAVFGPGSRAEVAIAGTGPGLGGRAVSGRVDRLVVEPERVLVVDYKSNRPSPDRIEDADPAYIAQMAVYRAVLQAVFPGRRVEAALVWTDGPKLMQAPENLMARALEALPPSG